MDGQRGRLVFADAHADGQLVRTPDVQREHRVYNVNGGDPYDSDNPETGHEIYIKRGSSYTNKTAATKRNDDGWRFTDWKYDDDHILGVNHKITYGSKTNDLSISQNDQTVVSGIPAEKDITLTA